MPILVYMDYDDTLCPSSWVISEVDKSVNSQKGRPQNDAFFDMESLFSETELDSLQAHAIALVEAVLSHHAVYKVTLISNGDSAWIESSLCSLLPKLKYFLEQAGIDVISSRKLYAPLYPHHPVQWKILAFQDLSNGCLNELKNKRVCYVNDSKEVHRNREDHRVGFPLSANGKTFDNTRAPAVAKEKRCNAEEEAEMGAEEGGKGPTNTRKRKVETDSIPMSVLKKEAAALTEGHVVPTDSDSDVTSLCSNSTNTHTQTLEDPLIIFSIGDGLHEREACIANAEFLGCSALSLKLKETPTPSELIAELHYVSGIMHDVLEYTVTETLHNPLSLDLEVVRSNAEDSTHGIQHFLSSQPLLLPPTKSVPVSVSLSSNEAADFHTECKTGAGEEEAEGEEQQDDASWSQDSLWTSHQTDESEDEGKGAADGGDGDGLVNVGNEAEHSVANIIAMLRDVHSDTNTFEKSDCSTEDRAGGSNSTTHSEDTDQYSGDYFQFV